MAYWPRRSRTRVDALFSINTRAVSRFFLDATKCNAVYSRVMSVRGKGRKAREVSACSIRCQKNLEKGTGQCHNKERAVPVCLSVLTLLVDVGTLGQEELQHALAV